jgi:hypothetical protein
MNNPNDPDQNQEITERNQKAIAYLDALREADERADRASCKLAGCSALIGVAVVFWWAIYVIIKALGTL